MTTWKIYISHDCCNDFTWGNDEASTRDNLAEMLRAHLDAMTATDLEHPDERDHYTLTTFIEAVCFLEKYPDRKPELVRRALEGRLTLSPWLCNTLWGSMSVEGQLRAMSAARRLEIETGVPINAGNHSEMPSLPLGAVTILAGAGVDWVCVPWLLYDTVYKTLDTPPVFGHLGPDGSRVNFIFDQYASARGLYIQGLKILQGPETIPEWTTHYESLGDQYPMRAFFAAGTHHDLFPEVRHQVPDLNAKLKAINALEGQKQGASVRLVNASLGRFVSEVGRPAVEKLPLESRSFGISWEAWPVGLAKIMADARLAEREYYDNETLLAFATLPNQDQHSQEFEYTEAARKRGDDVIAMLGEHAWNGMDERSHRINQHLRRNWVGELRMLGETLRVRALRYVTLEVQDQMTLFNPLGHARGGIVRAPASSVNYSVSQDWTPLIQQTVLEGKTWTRVFVAPEVSAFGVQALHRSNPLPTFPHGTASEHRAENTHFKLEFDRERSGLSSLVHRASGAELRVGPRNIGETVWWAGREHPLRVTGHEVLAHGPVLTRIAQYASAPGLEITTLVTVYPAFDHVDLEVRIHKTQFERLERVTQVFPVGAADAIPVVQTPGALIRLALAPAGDLHPGADQSRIASDGFVQTTHPNGLVSVANLESFLLRPDLEPLSFECLGNDQNAAEVSHDQGGERDFCFRYRLRFDPAGTPIGNVARWAAEFQHPLMLLEGAANFPAVQIQPDSTRTVSQALKPALDGRGLILRVWEVSGSGEPVQVNVRGFSSVSVCDLLERDLLTLEIGDDVVRVPIRGWGFAAIRLQI
jgi:Glycosyl hydrolases family 38 C-terminal beta sandwich domain